MTWRAEVGAALGSPVAAIEAIPSGDVNEAHRVTLVDRRVVFVKSHRTPPPGMFAAEVAGLAWLRGPVHVPEVLAHAEHWLALAWFERDKRELDHAALGRGLAQLHQRGAPRFGLDGPSYLATLAQDNAPEPDWPTFYVERRLRPLVAQLGDRALDGLLDRLRMRPDRFGPPEPPARLHGDLWWGNVAACGGSPVIYDPAVYGGHREIDLAMLAMFGALPDRLIAAYAEVAPLADGWRDRIAVHQLYPLAAHAVLFGGSYAAQLNDAMRHLV